MSKLSLLVYLNAYEDQNPSNAPNRNNFRWERDIRSIFASNPVSVSFSLAPGETRSLFSGTRTLTQDGTTQYSLTLVPFSTTYQLAWVGGTIPSFRTVRAPGSDTTTQVTVTTNGPVTTFASTGGTPFNLIPGGVIVGDDVLIGSQFNLSNQGTYKIISLSNTSFGVVNNAGVAEGPITLGSSFANQIRIFSAAGVQVGDTLIISGGFSPVTRGSYIITSVTDYYVQFSSVNTLPLEGPIVTDDIAIYFMAKKLVYAESDQSVTLSINNTINNTIIPLVTCECVNNLVPNLTKPGMFMTTATVYALSITNNSINTANVFLASVE